MEENHGKSVDFGSVDIVQSKETLRRKRRSEFLDCYDCTLVFARIASVMLHRRLWKGLAYATNHTEIPAAVSSIIDSFLEEHMILTKKTVNWVDSFQEDAHEADSDTVHEALNSSCDKHSWRGGLTKQEMPDLRAQVKRWVSGSEKYLEGSLRELITSVGKRPLISKWCKDEFHG